jgi:DNA-binding CsgD family transcriptional regulator
MQSRDVQPGISQNVSEYFPREKLLSALNDSKVGVVICDRRMRYKALNKTVAEIHNVPIEAHLGHYFHEIIGNIANQVIPLWENVFVTGQPSPSLEVTGRLLKRSESGRWIENLFPLKDDRGRVVQVGCFVVEIPSSPAAPSDSTPAVGVQSVTTLSFPNDDRITNMSLSPRERDVVRLIAEGKSNKEISSVLTISVRTVETYRARLMLKLGATSVAQLVHYAIRNRLITI